MLWEGAAWCGAGSRWLSAELPWRAPFCKKCFCSHSSLWTQDLALAPETFWFRNHSGLSSALQADVPMVGHSLVSFLRHQLSFCSVLGQRNRGAECKVTSARRGYSSRPSKCFMCWVSWSTGMWRHALQVWLRGQSSSVDPDTADLY